MIPAIDLKIGNWLQHQEEKGKVFQILEHGVDILCKGIDSPEKRFWYYDQLQPIVPDTEVLLKCGFAKLSLFPHLNAFRHKKYLFNLNIIANTYEISFGLIKENVALIHQKNIYLHQLQNLYYQLTNEELEVVF